MTLQKDLRTKASMISLGEKIAWGSDSGIMDAAADFIDADEKLMRDAMGSLAGYRRVLNDGQPCDAEKALFKRLEMK